MRLVSLGLVAFFVSIAGCGGGDDAINLVIDAGPPDAEIIPDSEPFVCPDDECDGVCVDFDTDETTCGDCDTACQGGAVCTAGTCACPPPFVPASPTFLFDQLTDMIPGAITGFGIYSAGGSHALGAAYPIDGTGAATVTLNTPYDLTGALEAPGIFAGYNVNFQTMTADAAYAATDGTITFTEICATGFAGTAADVVFTGIMSFDNPTPDPSGCMFTVTTLAFAFGDDCSP